MLTHKLSIQNSILIVNIGNRIKYVSWKLTRIVSWKSFLWGRKFKRFSVFPFFWVVAGTFLFAKDLACGLYRNLNTCSKCCFIAVCIHCVAGVDLWARDTQHPLRVSGRGGPHTLCLHHQGPLQQESLLPRLLCPDHGKSHMNGLYTIGSASLLRWTLQHASTRKGKLLSLLVKRQNVYRYNTRGAGDLIVPQSRLSRSKNVFLWLQWKSLIAVWRRFRELDQIKFRTWSIPDE